MNKIYNIFYGNKKIVIEYNSTSQYSSIKSDEINFLLNNDSELIRLKTSFPERLFAEFSSNFVLIEAAGGLIINDAHEWLMIYRLDHWDLPKGKIDPGESAYTTAVREILEECNINVSFSKSIFLEPTYHIYKLNEHFVLKRTYWYLFLVNDYSQYMPQVEENIQKIEWINKSKWEKIKKLTYPSIVELIRKTSLIL